MTSSPKATANKNKSGQPTQAPQSRSPAPREDATIDIAAIPVQDDVPVCSRYRNIHQSLVDKLSSMQPGQSFIVPRSLVSSVYQAGKALKPRAKVATRRESADTVRVWRLS